MIILVIEPLIIKDESVGVSGFDLLIILVYAIDFTQFKRENLGVDSFRFLDSKSLDKKSRESTTPIFTPF